MSQPSTNPKRFSEFKFKAREALLNVLKSKDNKKETPKSSRPPNVILVIFIAFMIALMIRTFFIQVFYVPTNAMETALSAGDRVIANKLTYGVTNPFWGASDNESLLYIFPNPFYKSNMPLSRKRYITRFTNKPDRMEIVVFRSPTGNNSLTKRIIGLPGEQVKMKKGIVYINGKKIKDNHQVIQDKADFGPVIVPADSYFVLGDNRATSSDSRHWGTVHRDNIIGLVSARIWPLNKFKNIR